MTYESLYKLFFQTNDDCTAPIVPHAPEWP